MTLAAESLYVCYWSLSDPLCQSQVLPYLHHLHQRLGVRFVLITFEQQQWRLSAVEETEMQATLRAKGIFWHPLRYHKHPPVLSSVGDMLAGIAAASMLGIRYQVKMIHARSTVAAAIAGPVARALKLRFFYDADGPLADEYAERGSVRKGGLVHRGVSWVEDTAFRYADRSAVLSTFRAADVARNVTGYEPVVLPCAVDLDRFSITSRAIDSSAPHFVYVGKSGGFYRTDWMFGFVALAQRRWPKMRFTIISHQQDADFEVLGECYGVSFERLALEPAEIPHALAQADVGLCFVEPTPSKRSCSPIKTAEYLAAGLLVVQTPGLGDFERWIPEARVGVNCLPGTLDVACAALAELMSDPEVRTRARRLAEEHVALEGVVGPRYEEIYRTLLK